MSAIFTVIDGVLLGIVLLGMLFGTMRGFFAAISKPIKIIGSLCITFCIASPVISGWTKPYFTNLFTEKISANLMANFGTITSATVNEELPFFLKIVSGFSGMDLSAVEATSGEEFIAQISAMLGASLGNAVAFAVTYLALFVIISLVLSLLLAILNSVVSKGPLGVINKILGFLLGTAVAMVLACIVASITASVSEGFVGGFIYDFFKNFNPLKLVEYVEGGKDALPALS